MTGIDVLIHNAGSLNGTRDVSADNIMGEQKLDNISMDRMRAAFEVNCLGVLRLQKILQPQLKSPGGKVVVISTGLASIGDNGSGGNYAYRASKAAVNMVAKCLSCDLKEKGIAVSPVAPGFIQTEFGPGCETTTKWGAKPVEQATKGILQVVEGMTLENTGTFWMVPSDGGAPKEMPW